MSEGDQDHSGVPVTMAVIAYGLDQALDLLLGQVLPCPQLLILQTPRNCSIYARWGDPSEALSRTFTEQAVVDRLVRGFDNGRSIPTNNAGVLAYLDGLLVWGFQIPALLTGNLPARDSRSPKEPPLKRDHLAPPNDVRREGEGAGTAPAPLRPLRLREHEVNAVAAVIDAGD
jgi:hypothetical protein